MSTRRDPDPGFPQREPDPPIVETVRVPRAPERTPRRDAVRTAWMVAVVTDLVQWVLWPFFTFGAVTPFDDVVDVVVAIILIRLLGWHWAFLPAFIAEIIPGMNLVPTWTAAVFLATRKPQGGVPTPRA